MLHLALIFLCTAQIIHFSRHWFALSTDLYTAHQDQRLKSHLKWNRNADIAAFGDARPGSALKRYG